MTYIKPPASHECKWRSGPPPDVGWWPASSSEDPELLRWWNGRNWSAYVVHYEKAAIAGIFARCASYSSGIQWTDRWWIK